jgi:DNA-binding LacI/PurR family transcriptional regulator
MPARRARDLSPGARPTLSEVAALAGVSRQTVSRVSRGGAAAAAVAQETQARVLAAIKAVGYKPDLVARALSTGSSRTIGVLGHHQNLFGSVSVFSGIETAAYEAGWRVSLETLPEYGPESVRDSVGRLISTGCDGIILLAPWVSDASTLAGLQVSVPIVTTSRVLGYNGPAVYPDAVASATEIVTHLLELGHKTVWHVAGPEGYNASALRTIGWKAALEKFGAHVNEPVLGDWTARSGYRAGLELLQRDGVTAVFAANDDMALGLIHALAEAGIAIPDDISVVGYDGTDVSEFFRPSLTTVRVDHLEHGRKAVEMIVAQLEKRAYRTPEIVRHELLIRASSASPRAALKHRSGALA